VFLNKLLKIKIKIFKEIKKSSLKKDTQHTVHQEFNFEI
jgi:hypothetical protein